MNLTPEAAIDLAFEQFDATAETAQMEQISGDGLMVLTLPDADWGCPTLMLYPDIFSNFLSQNGLERLLVTHPSRGAIFFTSADLEHAEDMMVETLRRGADDGHRQSQYVYSFTPDTGFVAHIYLPDDGPPEPAQARVLH